MKTFYESYHFIENHPAFINESWYSGIDSLTIAVSKCCKNNISEYGGIYVSEDNPRFKEFVDKNYKWARKGNDQILVPYEDYYGYKWRYDHVDFWVEGGASRYVNSKNINSFSKEDWYWERTHDDRLNCSGSTYEEAIVSFAKLVKENYGDFSKREFDKNSIIPKWIISNNKKFPAFSVDNPIFVNGQFNRNENNINVNYKLINEIWWSIKGVESFTFEKYEKKDVSYLMDRDSYFKNLSEVSDKSKKCCKHGVSFRYLCDKCGDEDL